MSKLVGVLGSVTAPGRLLKALSFLLDEARRLEPSLDTALVNLAEVRIAFADGRPPAAYGDDTAATIERIAAAEMVVLATPVYRASFTGALKNLLDHLPVEALLGKPCAILSMGATTHHFLGAEWHLRDVLTWFGALVSPTGVYLSSTDFVDGDLTDNAKAELGALAEALMRLNQVRPASGKALGPAPLAARRR